MKHVLIRRKNYLQIVSGMFSPAVFVAFVCWQLPSLTSDILMYVVPVFLLSTFVSLKSGLKPAAWITNDELYIRDGIFRIESIPLEKVEAMSYKVGVKDDRERGVDIHLLMVKMKGFSEWHIPIRDRIDHGKELRLFKFIRDNFFPLSLITPTADELSD